MIFPVSSQSREGYQPQFLCTLTVLTLHVTLNVQLGTPAESSCTFTCAAFSCSLWESTFWSSGLTWAAEQTVPLYPCSLSACTSFLSARCAPCAPLQTITTSSDFKALRSNRREVVPSSYAWKLPHSSCLTLHRLPDNHDIWKRIIYIISLIIEIGFEGSINLCYYSVSLLPHRTRHNLHISTNYHDEVFHESFHFSSAYTLPSKDISSPSSLTY